MISKSLKKFPAVFLTVAILFTTVLSMNIFSGATSFSPRLSAPASSNKYYYSNINPFYKYGYGMPNCTAYAFGRAYEILGTEPNLSWNNAEVWYSYNKSNNYYSYGQTPKLGAIACWSYNGGGGHVAVVEKIENGTITFSNSAYSGTNFYLSTASTSDSKAGGSSWWNFQGYIYILNDATPETTSSTTSASYKTGTYKTNVSTTLNMRSGAGTGYSVVASISNGVTLNVTQVKSSGGYTWGYTTYNGTNGWVALDYCDYIEPATTQPTTVAPATTQPTTVAPTTTQPTTVAPTTTQPTTVAPTTTQPTTVAPTTQVNTEPSETVAPTTESDDDEFPDGLGVGDVNGDGRISVIDVSLIQKYLADVEKLTKKQIGWCDVNFDGRVSVSDVSTLQKYLANLF